MKGHPMSELEALVEKLGRVRTELNARVFEREEETDGVLLAILSGQNALFLGDVGTAKTYHIHTASKLLGLKDFDILLSETVKPDQIFGPVDIPALAEGKQLYKYKDYAPDSEVLFFDEIFKANATVLNPLLWLMNEHKFRNGDAGVIDCPTRAVFAASNEIPTDPFLKAVYDRLLLRYEVKYIKDNNNLKKMLRSSMSQSEAVNPVFKLAEVDALRQHVKSVAIPVQIEDLAIKIRRQVEITLGFTMSDRRFLKSFRVMQASALLNGRKEVHSSDLEVLANIMWNDLTQVKKVQNIVFSHTTGDTVEISTYMERALEINGVIKDGGDLHALKAELKGIYLKLKTFSSRYSARCAAEVSSIGKMVSDIIKMRKDFELVYTDRKDKSLVYKLQSRCEVAWSQKELRAFGFRHKRKGNYWYLDRKAFRKFRSRCEVEGYKLTVIGAPEVSETTEGEST